MSRRQRLDAELVRRGLAGSRQHASELIGRGDVTLAGAPAGKAATQVRTDAAIAVHQDNAVRYASRGAHKLLGVLDILQPRGLTIEAKKCLDAGASAGGFTDVLLRRGAGQVCAVDVGYGQIAWRLRTDNRVRVYDRTNVRQVTAEQIGGPVGIVVSDLSFISLTVAMPALSAVCEPEGDMLLMIKPQFEVGKDRVGKGGVVRDGRLHADAMMSVCHSAYDAGWGTEALEPSPVAGPSGNIEYFCWLRADAPEPAEADALTAVARGPGDRDDRESR